MYYVCMYVCVYLCMYYIYIYTYLYIQRIYIYIYRERERERQRERKHNNSKTDLRETDVDWTIQSLVPEFYDGDVLSGPVTTEFHEDHNYQCQTVDTISVLRQQSPGKLSLIQ
jgi:hypothetical protein